MKIYIKYAVALIGGLTLFLSCSSDDNPASDSGTIPIVWSDGVLPGFFSVNADGQQVQFAQGNLQYRKCSMSTEQKQFLPLWMVVRLALRSTSTTSQRSSVIQDYTWKICSYGQKIVVRAMERPCCCTL